jgi:hypothetical protein
VAKISLRLGCVRLRVPGAPLAAAALALMAVASSATGSSPSAGIGVPFAAGDVFAGIGNGLWSHFDSTGKLLATLSDRAGTGDPYGTGMCFDPAGAMYATVLTGPIRHFSNDGTLLDVAAGRFSSGSFSYKTRGTYAESCLIVNGDTMFVSEVGGTGDILKLDLTGTQLANYDVSRSDWLDLAADKCTMFYSDEGPAIHRFDVCTNKPLTDFVSGGDHFFALRILPDGTVLAASNTSVKRFDPSGAQIATYTAQGEKQFFALNLDPDGVHFWSGGYHTGSIYKFAIAPTAPPVLSIPAPIFSGGSGVLAGLAIFGERIASQPTPPAVSASIPTLLLGLLVLLGLIAIAVIFALRRRRRSRLSAQG